MTLTGATPVQYSRGGFEENRKYQATGNGPRSVRRVSIIRRPITVRPVPPAVRYARVREGGRRKTETIPGALDGRLGPLGPRHKRIASTITIESSLPKSRRDTTAYGTIPYIDLRDENLDGGGLSSMDRMCVKTD